MNRINDQPRRSRRQSGIALVIVLGFLVLITVLIVAYFTSVTTESSVSKTYANGASAKFLADSAVNIVMGQIAKGTQGTNGTNRLTWASQPGMIRTWADNGLGNAAAGDCYKLYSSPQMVIPASVAQAGDMLSAMAADVPAAWNTEPALFTDLNAPVTDSSGRTNFPIIDGNNVQRLFVNGVGASGSNVLTYHSAAGSTPDIEGFYVQPSYVPNYNANAALSSTNTPVPMPVQWLYMLKDGTVISPDPSSSGSTATFQNASALIQSGSNPIVGRIAFWTDDETCKLNVNTASEGTYYAMPHADSPTDMVQSAKTSGNTTFGFAVSPPATGEFNRYPGHPATTCLSVALGSWMNSRLDQSAPNAYTSSVGNDQYYLKDLANYLTLVPRTGTGGSLAGTVTIAGSNGITYNNSTFNIVTTPTNRLYASFDELMFNPLRNPNTASSGPPQTYLTRAEIEELKFFLTASSRAPELTPFDTPKVSIWPQWFSASDRQKYQGPAQQLLAFCSSFGTATPGSSASGKNEYFWEWCTSSCANNLSMFANNSSSSSSLDWSVLRNQQLATYLCNLGKHNIPGYGAAFRSTNKYSDRCFSNIVLECLDYIRSCVARADYEYPASVTVGATTSGSTSEFTPESLWIAPLMVSDSILPGVSAGDPIKGFGYFPIFPEVVLGEGLSCTGSTPTPFIAFNSFTCPWSFPAGQQAMYATFSGMSNAGINPSNGTTAPSQYGPIPIHRRVQSLGPYTYEYGRNLPMRVYVADFPNYQFLSSGTSTVTLGGGGQAVQILFKDGAGRAFQTMNVAFPRTPPLAAPTITSTYMKNNMSGEDGQGDWLGSEVETYYTGCLFQQGHCVARGMECNAAPGNVAAGDWRILGGTVNAASGSAPSGSGTTGNLFSPVGGLAAYSSTNAQVHTLRVWCNNSQQLNNSGAVPTSSIAGTLAPSVNGTNAPILSSTDYGDIAAPFASLGMQGAWNINNRPGDWDTGAGVFADGPYINVADQVDGNSGGVPEQSYFPSPSLGAYAPDFSPNKRMASAIQFGSLPTGVSAAPFGSSQTTLNVTPRPWETLLFCPNPPARSSRFPPGADTSQDSDHIGFMNPPDHLLLQFFTLPVVQPYAISEPLSTAGKVNLNYQMAPFTSIERSTALRGVLKNTLVTGISGYDVKSKTYKYVYSKGSAPQASNAEFRYDINRDATVAGIEENYFSRGQIFKYPSEICDVFLVPAVLGWYPGITESQIESLPSYGHYNSQTNPNQLSTLTYDNMLAWWNPSPSTGDPLSTMSMTGENLREEPYDHIYPRLTTQSNTYTVHYRVQVLQKRPGSNNPAAWTEGQDQVVSENRGSSLIERYIDPGDPRLTGGGGGTWDDATINLNFTENAGSSQNAMADLSQLYKFRVISTKQFAP